MTEAATREVDVVIGAGAVGELLLGLWHAVPAYPTMSEVWLLEAYRLPG